MIEIKALESGEDYVRMGAVDEQDRTQSSGRFIFTASQFKDRSVPTMLVGAIGTPIQYRRGGNVRAMIEKMHLVASERGIAVALLHPFSFSYYRKFGYEKVSDHLILRFPTRLLDFVPRACRLVPYEDSMSEALVQCYHTFAKGRNLLLPRHAGSFGGDTWAYMKDGKCLAYLIGSGEKKLIVNHHEQGVFTVKEAAYTCPEGLMELFSYLHLYEGEFDEIVFANIAPCPEIEMTLRHYTHTKYTIVPDIMARVINTRLLLEAHTYPAGSGSFVIRVNDTLSTVKGTFTVTWENAGATVTETPDASPDLTVDAPALARLLYGYDGVTASSAPFLPGLTLHSPSSSVFAAFPKTPCGVFEHF